MNMPVGESETTLPLPRVSDAALPARTRVAMLLLNMFPMFHVLGIAVCLILPWESMGIRIASAVALLYLLPPLLARIIHAMAPIHEGVIELQSRDFITWLALLNLQVLFCRLPFLDECLRIVPGLYSMWLRLWGSRIGRLTYWSAGTVILERQFLEVGDNVIFGAGVRVNAHVLARNEQGETALHLGTIKIGDRVIVGGYSLLTSGTELASDQETKAFMKSPPFSCWQDGQRIKKTGSPIESE